MEEDKVKYMANETISWGTEIYARACARTYEKEMRGGDSAPRELYQTHVHQQGSNF